MGTARVWIITPNPSRGDEVDPTPGKGKGRAVVGTTPVPALTDPPAAPNSGTSGGGGAGSLGVAAVASGGGRSGTKPSDRKATGEERQNKRFKQTTQSTTSGDNYQGGSSAAGMQGRGEKRSSSHEREADETIESKRARSNFGIDEHMRPRTKNIVEVLSSL